MSQQQYIQFVQDHGISLQDKVGTLGFALKKEDALTATKILRFSNIPILGGDILVEENGKFRYRVESWHNNRKNEETASDFVQRSITETEDYITKFPEDSIRQFYYVLVPDM